MAWKILYIGFRSADYLHRVDLEPGLSQLHFILLVHILEKMEEVNTGLGSNFFLFGLSVK